MKLSISKYLLSLFILPLIVACSTSRNAGIPLAEVPAQYRFAAPDSGSGSGIAEFSWPIFFSEPRLKDLIDRAVNRNFDLQLALKNIEAANLQYRQVKWNYVPDLRLQAGSGSNRPSDNSLSGISAKQFLGTTHIEDFTAAINLSWEADIWGKIRNQKKSARAAYLQTEEARKLIQTNIVSNVAKGYYNLLMLDEQIRVAQKNLVLNDSTVQMIRLQFDAGQVTALAVEQALAQKMAAAQLIPLLEQHIALQEHALSLLTGNLPGRIDRDAPADGSVFYPVLSAGVPSALLSRRPDVRTAELDLVMANAKVGISKANMYPSLSITAAAGINSFKSSNWFNIPASLFGQAAGSLLQPLLGKRQLQTQYRIAKLDREKTVLQFRQTVLSAVGEVSDALVKIDRLSQQHRIASGRVGMLQHATQNAGLLFESGMASYLEVISAQGNVLQGELEIAAIHRDQLIARVELYRSLGGGWK